MIIDELKYYFRILRKQIYIRYKIDQIMISNGYLIYVDDYIMLKLKIDVPKSVSYSFDYPIFKIFCDLLADARSIDFNLNTIIINKEELIIPNKFNINQMYFYDFIDDTVEKECNFKCNLKPYRHGLAFYKQLRGVENLYAVVIDSHALHLIDKKNGEVQTICSNKNSKVFPLGFKSLEFSRFFNLGNHFNANFLINPEDQMLCFDNGESRGIMIGTDI